MIIFQQISQSCDLPASFSHGSAQNIDVITQFICDTLTNSCAADQTAKNTCATAKIAADTQTKGTGNQADAFNNVFGITTNFAAIPSVDNQGHIIDGTGTASNSSSSALPSSQLSSLPSSTSVSVSRHIHIHPCLNQSSRILLLLVSPLRPVTCRYLLATSVGLPPLQSHILVTESSKYPD
jgi:hypothetical protein